MNNSSKLSDRFHILRNRFYDKIMILYSYEKDAIKFLQRFSSSMQLTDLKQTTSLYGTDIKTHPSLDKMI